MNEKLKYLKDQDRTKLWKCKFIKFDIMFILLKFITVLHYFLYKPGIGFNQQLTYLVYYSYNILCKYFNYCFNYVTKLVELPKIYLNKIVLSANKQPFKELSEFIIYIKYICKKYIIFPKTIFYLTIKMAL